jgi:hypothetical protein
MKNLDELQHQLDDIMASIDLSRLRQRMHAYAQTLNVEACACLVDFLSGAGSPAGQETDVNVKDALTLLEDCRTGKVYLTKRWNEKGDWADRDDEYVIKDENSVIPLINRVIDTADVCAQNLDFASALQIYYGLADLSLTVMDTYSGETSYGIDELMDLDCFASIDFAVVGGNAIYAAYRLDVSPMQRASAMAVLVSSRLCHFTEYELFLACGHERFDGLPSFLPHLFTALAKTGGDQCRNWLRACATTTLLKEGALLYQDVHPSLWRMLMQKLLEEDEPEEALTCGDKALAALPAELVERSRVANLCFNIYLLLSGSPSVTVDNVTTFTFVAAPPVPDEKGILYLFERFVSCSDARCFFSLYNAMDSSGPYWSRKLLAAMQTIPDTGTGYDVEGECTHNAMEPQLKAICLFLLEPSQETFATVAALGTRDAYFEGNRILNFFVAAYALQYHPGGCALHLLLPELQNDEYPGIFSSLRIGGDEELDKTILLWCIRQIHKIVSAVLGDRRVERYGYAAILVVSIDLILYERGLRFSHTQTAREYYLSHYPGCIEFVAALDDAM